MASVLREIRMATLRLNLQQPFGAKLHRLDRLHRVEVDVSAAKTSIVFLRALGFLGLLLCAWTSSPTCTGMLHLHRIVSAVPYFALGYVGLRDPTLTHGRLNAVTVLPASGRSSKPSLPLVARHGWVPQPRVSDSERSLLHEQFVRSWDEALAKLRQEGPASALVVCSDWRAGDIGTLLRTGGLLDVDFVLVLGAFSRVAVNKALWSAQLRRKLHLNPSHPPDAWCRRPWRSCMTLA